MTEESPLVHGPDCNCDDHVFRKSKKMAATRREFLCLAVGAAGVVGTATAASAKSFIDLINPSAERIARTDVRMDVPAGKPRTLNLINEDTAKDPIVVTLPKLPDMHTHLRQGKAMGVFIDHHLDGGNDVVLAMPNTKPPVSRVSGAANEKSWSIESYLQLIKQSGGEKFRDVIVPLYLTADTTAQMIDEGAKSGLLRAVKYYPPKGTTNSDSSVPIDKFIGSDLFKALEHNDIVACFHGEKSNIKPEEFFDRDTNAEFAFYREKMPRIVEKHSRLRISCEHLTTAEGVNFVRQQGENVVGTITPQHLLYTVGHLLQAWEADLYCMPLVKFEKDRAAIRAAVIGSDNHKFIAGTDNAPHPRIEKSTPCGCGSGCYVGGIAPQLYAQAFEEAGLDLSSSQGQTKFRRFMAENAWRFWRIKPSLESIRVIRKPSEVRMVDLPDGQQIAPLPLGITCDTNLHSVMIPWSLQI